jgi:cytochrome c553
VLRISKFLSGVCRGFGWVAIPALAVAVAISPPPISAAPQEKTPSAASALAVDAVLKELRPKTGVTSADVSFKLTNVSARAIVITNIAASCGCMDPTLPSMPFTLGPGSNTVLSVDIDFFGKRGTLMKTVVIETPIGEKVLSVKLILPEDEESERLRNQQLALADRQAVFKGDCARCHATPAKGKSGKELYTAVCGVCHDTVHRATMVPDLAKVKTPGDRGYWEQWIAHGKKATLMPAFAEKEGGPLTDPQISSLAEWLVERIPAPAKAK